MEKLNFTPVFAPDGMVITTVGRGYRAAVREFLKAQHLVWTEQQVNRTTEFVVPLPDGKDSGSLRVWLDRRKAV